MAMAQFMRACLIVFILLFVTIILVQYSSLLSQLKKVLNESDIKKETKAILRTDHYLNVDVKKVCSVSPDIYSINDHFPPSEFMGLEEILPVLKAWHDSNCVPYIKGQNCLFASIGQHLLHHAIQQNKTFFTVQVGAMDGKSNDPMYSMFVRGENTFTDFKPFDNLRNWLPVLIEPVPVNYNALIDTYRTIAETKHLGCAIPINALVSYNSSKATCPFCYMNTHEDAPEDCKALPDWMRLQLGTLDCDYLRIFFSGHVHCVLEDPLPCSSITQLLSDKFLSSENIAMLQIDVEGYEHMLLEGFMKELPDDKLPYIIHFEHKVMKQYLKKQLEGLKDAMEDKGYILYDQGEDYLAIKLNSTNFSVNKL
uniref:Methyltransferase FkbM domain-containing protein n=1 Tax=Ditylum brightwellii TaxID=49249 RepID=A0A7S1Z3L5_9STRA|mmetsp:Transcript_23702/g.35348  ORF Transcript_23702/g.35348 Transcript_23702/m.35348 type:complete len:367 (+) Transcript_23702:53-1153(+)